MPKVNLLKSFENQSNAKPKLRSKRKKVKYRKMSFKLTEVQYQALLIYCGRQKATPVRYLKALVNQQVERYKQELPPVSLVSPNQLTLF